MQTKGTPFRKKRTYAPSTKSDGIAQFLPFPVASVTTILLIVLCLSTLSALYIGARRSNGVPAIDFSTIPSAGTIVSEVNDNGPSKAQSEINGNDSPQIMEIKDGNGPTIHSFQDLTSAELHPKAGPDRHIVSPPSDELPVTLVTCTTTVGYLHIMVHPSWAPLGAQRFLQMVDTKYFSAKVALMRCVRNFLCQFGIAGDPSLNAPVNTNLQDDPNWLPEGPTHMTNELGVYRFGKGYMAYAGSGKNSRGNQLIMALKDNKRLGGGSPWEVPWGEIVGKESFETIDKIYTGYGERGPSQGRLMREGSSESVQKDFPKLDYIVGCDVIDSK